MEENLVVTNEEIVEVVTAEDILEDALVEVEVLEEETALVAVEEKGGLKKFGGLLKSKVVDLKNHFPKEKAKEMLQKGSKKAREIIESEKADETLQLIEKRLEQIDFEQGAEIAAMLSMARSYVIKEYTQVPVGTIIAIVTCLLAVLKSVTTKGGDIKKNLMIPTCLTLIEKDLESYKKWRKETGKELKLY